MLGELDRDQNRTAAAQWGGRPYWLPRRRACLCGADHLRVGRCRGLRPQHEGQKLHMMRANPFVCFEVEDIDDLANWHSVIAWGVFEELACEDEARAPVVG